MALFHWVLAIFMYSLFLLKMNTLSIDVIQSLVYNLDYVNGYV